MGDFEENAVIPGLPEELREQLHRAEAACRKIEECANNEDFETAFRAACDEYLALPLPPEYAEVMSKKFNAAQAAAQAARAAVQNAAAELQKKKENAANQLERCKKALEKLARVEILLPKRAEIEDLEKKYAEVAAILPPEQTAAEDFNAAFAIYHARMEAEEKANTEKSTIVNGYTEELKKLLAGDDMKSLQERKTALEKTFGELSGVPKESADAFKAAVREAGTKLAQHYETLDLARWESYTLKTKLCDELAALQNVPDTELAAAAKKLNETRTKWKELGAVPKAKFEEINPRYLELTRALQHRVDEHFAKLRQQHKESAAAKNALCEEAEKLADKTDWNDTAAAFKDLQKKWKEIPGAGSEEHKLYARFRASADKFFNARGAYFDERNKKFDAAAEVKQNLIKEAETLAASPSPEAIRRAKELRASYQAAGGVGKREMELSKAFNAALDRIFNARREEFAAREKRSRELLAELDTLSASLAENPNANARNRYREICTEWRELSCRQTFSAEEAAKKRFESAMAGAGKQLLRNQTALYREIAPALLAEYEALCAGTPADEAILVQAAKAEALPKLRHLQKMIEEAAAGNAKTKEKLAKQGEQAVKEQNRICEELENLAGIGKPAPARSLADELTAAIAGNFGAHEVKTEKKADAETLIAEFINYLPLDRAAFEQALERFEKAIASKKA